MAVLALNQIYQPNDPSALVNGQFICHLFHCQHLCQSGDPGPTPFPVNLSKIRTPEAPTPLVPRPLYSFTNLPLFETLK